MFLIHATASSSTNIRLELKPDTQNKKNMSWFWFTGMQKYLGKLSAVETIQHNSDVTEYSRLLVVRHSKLDTDSCS